MQINVNCVVMDCNILVLKENEMVGNDGSKVQWKTCTFMCGDNISQDVTVDKEIFPQLQMGKKENLVLDISGEKKTGFQTVKAKIVGIVKASPNK